MFKITVAFLTTVLAVLQANAETHTVTFTNNCGYGTPELWSQSGQLLSSGGAAYTTNGPAYDLIAYLQDGTCGQNGANCTVVDVTLANGDSSAEIFFVARETEDPCVSFSFYNGCDGIGETCPTTSSPKTCAADNVDIEITFC
ncbi:uncharacterized protein C8Q71DRAFT_911618 [Rhodofomes roseus]|uniref:Uncharacterized protein n=1 Tax=Rhodofomes roseus TaxID=34475 RepID=A0A4Y9XYS9_9APHY|nr:uncharacterized protein C8Q71DRAFT_911618 [Rhodofomes roseus]KAH9830057.1 hypothetical protein C8Q71DRAFT_911618 [Rhodofomes roseus]TFY54593.1 hypothetical protein EVJ58_g8769 [Rhodofomes roseus]